ncbi:MAG: hypothetical protein ACOZNI_37060 [Myxococcota bacterium]
MTDRASYARSARERADALYAGARTPHRSCGIALAETFGLPTPAYQSLRKGGITGEGPCGAVAAGTLVLGELLGDPDPTGAVTPALREAIPRYRTAVAAKIDGALETACNTRTAPLGEFAGERRKAYCTRLAAIVAESVAEVLWDLGRPVPIPPAPWVD